MRKPLSRLLVATLIAALTPSVARGQAGIHYYRYELLTRSQDARYAGEVPADAKGRFYLVETDSLGRISRTALLRNGHRITQRIYSYAPGSALADGFETFADSEKTGRVKIQRNASGERTRDDYLTVSGESTGYNVYSYRADSVETTSYAPDGRKRQSDVSYYSPSGVLTRMVAHSNPDDQSFYTDSDFNEGTGLRKGRMQFEGGSLTNNGLFNYDEDGDLIGQDVFDAAGNWFAGAELVDGLTTTRFYDSSKELRYTYDEKRRVKETTLFFQNMLICRFIYDRLPDGTVKRTVALGPNGEQWAEYPDTEIVDVRQNGQPINGKTAIISKPGNWY